MKKELLLLFILVIGAPLRGQVHLPITADDNTVVLDHFDSASIGETVGTTNYTDGLSGLSKAIDFLNSGNFVIYSNNADLTYKGTVEMWINISSYNKGLLNINWFKSYSSPSSGHVIHLGIDSEGKIGLSGWSGIVENSFKSNEAVPLNIWTHIAVSWGDSTKIYINGKKDLSSPLLFRPAVSSGNSIYIPYWGNKIGYIDELHISKIQRTDEEIKTRVITKITSANPTISDSNTLILDHFNSVSNGETVGTTNYIDGLTGLDKVIDFSSAGNYNIYPVNANITNAGTVEMWAYLNSYNKGLLTINWSKYYSSPSGGYVFHLGVDSNGNIKLSGWSSVVNNDFISKSAVPLNSWTHIAVSWGDSTKIYINGVADTVSVLPFRPSVYSGNYLYLPYWGSQIGYIDELHVSKVQRTNSEIASRVAPYNTNTGINKFTINNNTKIYPNPVTENLTIESDEDIQSIELINLSGQIVKKYGKQNIISLLNIQSGTYIIKINFSNNRSFTKHIIKN